MSLRVKQVLKLPSHFWKVSQATSNETVVLRFCTANIAILNNIVQLLYIFLNGCVYFFTLLETKERNIHRGALLDKAVRESSTNITQMVKRLGISRGTFYNHTKDPNLSYEQLTRYGKVIKHDFSQDLPEMKKFVFEEPEVPYGVPKTFEEAIEQRDYWRERYYKKHEELLRLLAKMAGTKEDEDKEH